MSTAVIVFIVVLAVVIAYLVYRAKKMGIDTRAEAEQYAKEHIDDAKDTLEQRYHDYFSKRPVDTPVAAPPVSTVVPEVVQPSTPDPTYPAPAFPTDPNAPQPEVVAPPPGGKFGPFPGQ